jgi:pimeloyl-ACP methyl ester carboxylesterase
MIFTVILKTFHRLAYGPLPAGVPEDRAAGLVLVADGIGGFDLCATGMQYAVGWSGWPLAVRAVGWGHGLWRWYRDLTNTDNHAAQAEALAAKVSEYRARHPDAPVYLVGKSGGTGIVAWALERLPEQTVDGAVLLAPALSPGYDLSRALRAVRREMIVHWSPLDVFILGIGTCLFGTVDRVRAPGAGMVGFRTPPTADPATYGKLRQVRWRPRMAAQLDFGGHLGPDNPLFLRRYIVPRFEPVPGPDQDAAPG